VLGGIGTASSIISVSVTEAGPLIDDRLGGESTLSDSSSIASNERRMPESGR
jgi:hypothetical protein